ncbi:MAG: AIR synthase related protein [Candidatus Helarchaeota archaeon]
MQLREIVQEIKNFIGVKRKQDIAKAIKILTQTHHVQDSTNVIKAFGEDSAVIEIDSLPDEYLLLALDGMWEKLIENSPYLAGYFSILVNVNDIIVKGGRPIAVLNMMASNSIEARKEMFKGITDGCKKFKVPMIGGHLHPDSLHSELAVSILGIVKKNQVIYSDSANVDDDIVIGIDFDGQFHPKFQYAWDTTTKKNSEQIYEKYEAIWEIAEGKLATACKDISNPGMIGTLGMLLDASNKGGIIDFNKIPIPKNVEMVQWLKAYPGFGVVLTTSDSDKVLTLLDKAGIKSEIIGKVTNTNKLIITHETEEHEIFDFTSICLSGKVQLD